VKLVTADDVYLLERNSHIPVVNVNQTRHTTNILASGYLLLIFFII